jgi:hypothetical protein
MESIEGSVQTGVKHWLKAPAEKSKKANMDKMSFFILLPDYHRFMHLKPGDQVP